MKQHLYAIGELVRFRSSSRSNTAPAGNYRIMARLPQQEGEPCYRIKSEVERHDRIAREGELRDPR
jgi:hypothetical protein